MHILLAPSEGKTPGSEPLPLDLKQLIFPQLLTARQHMQEVLTTVSARPDALEVLQVGARVAAAVAANCELATAPTAPAYKVYTGVAFAAAALDEIPQHLQPLWIASGLFGFVRATDRIPAYRLSGGVALPGLATKGATERVSAFWRRTLQPVMDQALAGQLVVDCRSGVYQDFWSGSPDAEVINTQILREQNGQLRVVSHHAKRWRGLMTRALLDALAAQGNQYDSARPASVSADWVAQVVATVPGVSDVDFVAPKRGSGASATLQVIAS